MEYFVRWRFRPLTNLFSRLGMHEGAAAPSYSIRSGGMYAARSGPSGRFRYHFPAVAKGDRKMMQLEKMKNSFFRRVLTLSTPRRPPKRLLRGSCLLIFLFPAMTRAALPGIGAVFAGRHALGAHKIPRAPDQDRGRQPHDRQPNDPTYHESPNSRPI